MRFANEFGFKTVIVGGTDSWKIADYLKQNNISVILNQVYSLPAMQDDDYDLPYKTPYLLQQAGVLYCISDADQSTKIPQPAFDAGTAVGFGTPKSRPCRRLH